ncbi:GNAT family N-acetyltransferase [Ammoniphilus sp. YIM 78166]|uniref:GNAT family N-acetyltransferase n=1 Tax=Ammoniphilus sp. YIM 78166 TaxID=1644106 RepID=UPI00106FE3DC|nr:GNAT family N-acetyltransferase [Ammoniphilus sp. YIM 78166]
MLFRKIAPDETTPVYQMGYREWSKGRTYKQYVKENQKEEDKGTRYVLVDGSDNLIGSLILISYEICLADLSLPVFGLGSFVIIPEKRGLGYGKQMLDSCFSTFQKQVPAFLLYSDIDPSFYYSFQFKELPAYQQRYAKSVCMLRAEPAIFKEVSKLPVQQIPAYF